MAKGGKKTAKKGAAAKRSAPPAQEKQATKEAAQGPVTPKNDLFCMTASSWGTGLSLLALGTVAFLCWVTQSERCNTLPYWEPVWGALEKYGIASRPTDVALANVCTTIHEVTRSCLFLSGGVTSTQGKVHNSVSHAWERLQSVWGVETTSHASAVPEVLYERDRRDVLFAVTWGIALLALRGVLMHLVLLPSARLLVQRPPPQKMAQIGHRNKYYRSIDRFAEQFWIAILYSASLVLVLSFWVWKPEQLWIGYPHTTMDALTKAVYLWEASNYIHQLFVLNIEARRSDHVQMMVHHIVTLLLIGGSYVCCFSRVGLVILLLMDPSDILLAYMGLQKLCDAMFGAFMLSWTFTRHIGYMIVMWSCIYDAPRLIPYQSPADLHTGHVFTYPTYVVFIALLAILQVILLIWFSMILKVTYRVLTNAGAIDSRSDEDSD